MSQVSKSLDLAGVASVDQAFRLARHLQQTGVSAEDAADAFRRMAASMAGIARSPEQVLRDAMIEAAERDDGMVMIRRDLFRSDEGFQQALEAAVRGGLIEYYFDATEFAVRVHITEEGRALVAGIVEARRVRGIEADKGDVFSNRRNIQLED